MTTSTQTARLPLILAFVLLVGCDTSDDFRDLSRVFRITEMEVSGFSEDEQGIPVISDTLRHVFKIGVGTRVDLVRYGQCSEPCIINTEFEDPLATAKLYLDRDIRVDGSPLRAGTDLAPYLSDQQRFDLGPTGELDPRIRYRPVVSLDSSRFSIPAGQISATVRWHLVSGTVFSDSTRVLFEP